MTEPTEIEKKIAEHIAESDAKFPGSDEPFTAENFINMYETNALRTILTELIERRLKAHYLGPSSITGRDSSQERID